MKTAARRAALLSAPAAEQANTAAPPKPMRSRVSPGVAAGRLRKRVAPEYPQKARDNRIQGTVVLKARISTEGDVAELWVVSGDPALAAAAIEAVKQWKYKPFSLNGQPVEIETTIQVNFTLSG